MKINQKLLNKYLTLKQSVLVKYSEFHHIDSLVGPNVLVLSPHPDDDVLGCGGTIIRHISQGHSVYIVYLCQGDKGIDGLDGAEAYRIRKIESSNAANLLGVKYENLIYLSQQDNQLKPNNLLIKKLEEIIEKINPDIIYLPSFTDNHADHFQTNVLLKQVKMKNVLVAGYEIWTPHIPNRVIDISQQMELKILAIKAHKSQLNTLDYLNAIKGLNQYRACLYPKKKYEFVETFMISKRDEYFKLF